MLTTLNAIRAHSPCATGWSKLLRYLGKTGADDEPLLITTILDSNGVEDALWCLRAVEGYREIDAKHARGLYNAYNAVRRREGGTPEVEKC